MNCKRKLCEWGHSFILAVIATPCLYFLQNLLFKLSDQFLYGIMGLLLLIIIVVINRSVNDLAFNLKGRLVIVFLSIIYVLLSCAIAYGLVELLNLEETPGPLPLVTWALVMVVAFLLWIFLDCLIRI